MRYILFIFLLLTCISCSTDTEEDTPKSLFATPTVIEAPDTEAQSQPLVPQPDPGVPIVAPIVGEPEDVKVPDRVFDILAPQLVESTVDSGSVDPNTDVISLRFNEDITEIDIKLVDDSDRSMRWILSIDTITGRRIFLTRIGGRRLVSDRKHYIKGFVADAAGNKKNLDIEFRAVEENRDRTRPVLLTQSINHEARNVSINTDQFVFTFNENIDEAEATLVRGEDWRTGPDMRWTRFIDKKTIVLLKTRGKALSLRNGETYWVVFKARDASGNWFPGPGSNIVRIIRFTTQR